MQYTPDKDPEPKKPSRLTAEEEEAEAKGLCLRCKQVSPREGTDYCSSCWYAIMRED